MSLTLPVRWPVINGERDVERCAGSFPLAFGPDPSSVQLHESSGECEPQTGSLSGVLCDVPDLFEGFENPL